LTSMRIQRLILRPHLAWPSWSAARVS